MTMCPRPMCPRTKSRGQCIPWTKHPLDDASLGRRVSWTTHFLDEKSLLEDAALDEASLTDISRAVQRMGHSRLFARGHIGRGRNNIAPLRLIVDTSKSLQYTSGKAHQSIVYQLASNFKLDSRFASWGNSFKGCEKLVVVSYVTNKFDKTSDLGKIRIKDVSVLIWARLLDEVCVVCIVIAKF
jgi:hypothetical protein